MAKNYVCCQPAASEYKSCDRTSRRGVNFVIQREGRIVPVEVKSADNTKAQSLGVYMNACRSDCAIRLSTKNFGFEDGENTIPLYAAFCI